MNDFLTEALELTKAQASVHKMTEDEIMSMVTKLSARLQGIASGEQIEETAEEKRPAVEAKKSIREKSIICLECGKIMKVLTKRHLALHGLDAASYREKWGFKKGTPLTCKELQRSRRAKMKDMELWKKRAILREQKAKIDFGSIEDL